jgi:hypothetical protein
MQELQKTSHLTDSSVSLLTGKDVSITPEKAWTQGTNIQKALKHYPTETRAYLIKAVMSLVEDIDATKTLSTDEQYRFTCRAIIEEHPTLKIEEIHLAFDYIRKGKFGNLYGRLKTAEILEALKQYEVQIRADIVERTAHNEKFAPLDIDTSLIKAINDSPIPKGHGSGSRLRKHLDRMLPNTTDDETTQQ